LQNTDVLAYCSYTARADAVASVRDKCRACRLIAQRGKT